MKKFAKVALAAMFVLALLSPAMAKGNPRIYLNRAQAKTITYTKKVCHSYDMYVYYVKIQGCYFYNGGPCYRLSRSKAYCEGDAAVAYYGPTTKYRYGVTTVYWKTSATGSYIRYNQPTLWTWQNGLPGVPFA